MFFILSKVLLFFTFPLTWILILLILAYIFRSRRISKRLVIGALVLFFFFSNTVIFCEVLKRWEGRNEGFGQEHYDGVIVLGGYSGWNSRHEMVTFSEGSDRLIKGLEFYKTGRANKIILSGGSGLVTKPEEKESAWSRALLIDLDVPDEDIILEDNSRNTHENAEYTKDLIGKMGMSNGHFLLITSAFHMPRAQRCFEKTGLNIEPYRVDFKVDDTDYVLSTFIIPSAYTLESWHMLFKEWLGFMAYAARGYF